MGGHTKNAPDGLWYRCPEDGCDFCDKDAYIITSDKIHWRNAHPGDPQSHQQIFKKMKKIPEAEGIQWKKEHREAYRHSKDLPGQYAPGKRARAPKAAKQPAVRVPGGEVPSRARTQQSLHAGSNPEPTGASRGTPPATPNTPSFPTPDPDAMDVEAPTTSRGLTPTPEPAYDHKWKCYVCNKLYTAKASVERHFLYTHLKTHYLFQPYRVPKLAYDKTTGKFVKLLNEVPQHPWFTGLCVELRQLIFEQVLSISQHPEQTDDVFRVQALQLPGTLADEAAAALKHSNLFVRITTYYSHAQEGEDDCQLVRNLARNIDAILEPNIADNLDVEPALHLMLDDPSVVEGPKVATSFLFAYNEGTFATLIRNLIAVGDDIGAFSIRFRSLFAAPRQRYAAADIIRYLGYLRLPVSVAISDVMDIIEIRELKRRIESDFSTHQGVIDLLKQLIVDSDDFMQQNEYSRALATLKFAAGVWEDDSVPFTTDPTPSRNAIDELCGRIHLLGCQVINSMTIEATGQGRLETVSFHYLEEAAFDWAAGAFIFSVILELLRGQAHLTRGVAYKHLTRYFKERNEPGDASTAAQYRLEARKDFYFATLVLDGEQGLEARRELIQHDFYDHTETNAEIAGLVSHYPIQYGQVFTGNRRLLETWEGEELDHIVDRRDRPLGWE